MQEIHAKPLISRLSLVQNIFYHYIHGMKRLIIPIICMLLPLAGCHERKPLPGLDIADSLLVNAGDKSGALRIFLQIEEQLKAGKTLTAKDCSTSASATYTTSR